MHVRTGDGRPDAEIMIVGEAFGETEEREGVPFAGSSGQELNRMLQDAGILRSECYCTNVVNARPPANNIELWLPIAKSRVTSDMVRVRDRFVKPILAAGYASLQQELSVLRPRLIIALGNTALWALTGKQSVTRWRGSLLELDIPGQPRTRVVPTLHPTLVLRQFTERPVVVHDLKRAKRELVDPVAKPKWNFRVRPTLAEVLARLEALQAAADLAPLWLDLDLETKAGHIACCGLSWSILDALTIPFMCDTSLRGYWANEVEEGEVVWRLYKLLTHPNCWVRGQNILYDCQYTYKHWHWVPNVKQDTMISQHTLWPGMRKSLDFQASMYCEYYVQWKPEKSAWKEGG